MKSKADVYTKFILTIIAVCLSWICIRDMIVIPKAYAAGIDDIADVRIRAIERTSLDEWVSLLIEFIENMPVEIKNEILPVDVKNVDVIHNLV